MSKNLLIDFLDSVRKMGYYPGGTTNSLHEKSISSVLKQTGFKYYPLQQKIKLKIKKLLLIDPTQIELIPQLKEGCFCYQPFNTQNSPDFILRYKNRIWFIEAKSTKTKSGVPLYNSGGAVPGYINIFSNKFYDETIIYLGQDICSSEYKLLLDMIFKEIRQQLKDKLENYSLFKNNPVGYTMGLRSIRYGRGSSKITNYFTHPQRQQWEKNVYDFVRG